MYTEMARPSILYFQQNAAFGSAEGYLYDLANHMAMRGYDVHLAFPDIEAMKGFESLTKYGVVLHKMPLQLYTGNLATFLLSWVKYFRNLRPALVHFNDPCPSGSVAAFLAGVPIRLMMHHTPELVRHYNLRGRLTEWTAFRLYSLCIYSNPASRLTSMKRDGVSESRGCVIPFGLPAQWFGAINTAQVQETRTRLGLTDEDILILIPARLSAQKRHDVLLKAAQEVLVDSNHVWFFLAGDGELRLNIEQSIAAHKLQQRVKILGHRTDIFEIVSAADIVALSSDFEGFPYALLEAGARAVPIVATRVGGVNYMVADGETGLLVPPGDSDSLAQALLRLIHDRPLRQQMGYVARRRAEQLFTMERMIDQTEALYQTLLDNRIE